jgi:hypothetical protein
MNFKNFVLGVGIFVVYLLVLIQGIQTFYPDPDYSDYCGDRYPKGLGGRGLDCPSTPSEVINQRDSCYDVDGIFIEEYDENGCLIGGYCDECSIEYEKDTDAYTSNIFLICILIGLVVFFMGLYLLKKEPVGSALIASSIFTIVFGTARNWRNFTESWRFLILFVLLVLLIWFTLKINSTKKKSWMFWKK